MVSVPFAMSDYINLVEDVRSYIASYAGETTLVRPYGSHLQTDEAKKTDRAQSTCETRAGPPKSATSKNRGGRQLQFCEASCMIGTITL